MLMTLARRKPEVYPSVKEAVKDGCNFGKITLLNKEDHIESWFWRLQGDQIEIMDEDEFRKNTAIYIYAAGEIWQKMDEKDYSFKFKGTVVGGYEVFVFPDVKVINELIIKAAETTEQNSEFCRSK